MCVLCSSQVPGVADALHSSPEHPEEPEQSEAETDEACGGEQPAHPGTPAQVTSLRTELIGLARKHCKLLYFRLTPEIRYKGFASHKVAPPVGAVPSEKSNTHRLVLFWS